MPMVLTGRKKRLVLDIGTSAVRLCELSKTKTGYQLARYVQREFDSDPALGEEQRKALRVQALKDVLKEARTRQTKTVFGVPGQSVFTRSRTLPPVPEFKVNQIVKYEIQQQIPFGLDQIAMDYQILSRNDLGGYEVMMAAIKVDVVEKHLEFLKAVKRTVAMVDVSPLAAYNWLKHTGDFGSQGECVALIDMGATTTDIVIERAGQFRFTRPLNVGGNDITKALAAEFNLEFAAAERLKRERGFAPTGDSQRDGKGGEAVGKALQRLCGEIMRSFAYFRSLPGGGQVGRVILSGGGACLKNIAPYLREQLGVDVRLAQPLTGLTIGSGAEGIKKAPEQACVLLGMALRCLEPVPLEINLIPPRLVEAARRREQAVYWAFSITALILSFLSVVPAAANENKLVKARIDQLKGVIGAYDPELVQRIRVGSPPPVSTLNEQLTRRKGQLQTLENHVTTLDNARRQRRFWLEELSLVNEARPTTGGLWFSSVETTVYAEQEGNAPPPPPGFGPQPGFAPGGLRGGGAEGAGLQASAGFPGIQPRGMAVQGDGGGGSLRGFSQPAGVPGVAPAQEAGPQSTQMPRANSMILQGYANSPEVITQYLDELKRVARQQQTGLYLSVDKVLFRESSVQRVGAEVLYNAPVDAGVAIGGPAPMGIRGSQSAPGYQAGAPTLFSFRVQVVFRRTKDRPEPPAAAGAPGGNPA